MRGREFDVVVCCALGGGIGRREVARLDEDGWMGGLTA
jgi:hypothetical protein